MSRDIYDIQNQFQADFKPSYSSSIIILKTGCKRKPTSVFVNLRLKTQSTGNDWSMNSSTFWSMSWQSLTVTKISFRQRLDWFFVQLALPQHVKKSDFSSHCKSKTEEMLGDKAIGWMLSLSWLFMWLHARSSDIWIHWVAGHISIIKNSVS